MAVFSKAVIDLSPWPHGLGFEKAEIWWDYIRVQTEDNKLELLMTVALLSQEVCLLMLNHDHELLGRFEFSEETLLVLTDINAETLYEFAQQVILRISA